MNTTKTSFSSTDSLVHVGVDLAKNVFQVAYKDPTSSKFVNRQLKRKDFKEFLETGNNSFKRSFVHMCGKNRKLENKKSISAFDALTASFSWNAYIIIVTPLNRYNVSFKTEGGMSP